MTSALFDPNLIERYDGRGPRYTSYPTAVQLQPGFGEAEYREQVHLANDRAGTGPLSIYVHIPFCHSLCYYCGCSKIVTRNRERADQYLTALEREISIQGELFSRSRTVRQLHLGGGTPTYFDEGQMSRLMAALYTHFTLETEASREFSIEIDPRTVAPAAITALTAQGFNRISMGVQDFEPAVQDAINRQQTAGETRALVDAARAAGFGSVSLDLIYGLPLQTVAGFNRTLDRVLEMRPDRLAIYSYAHLPNLFNAQKLIPEAQLPASAVKLEILRGTIERLTAEGYVYIGMDHFALAGDELTKAQARGELQRNFQGYSTHAHCDLIALGMTAIGHVGHSYSQNAKDIKTYEQLLAGGQLPIQKGLVMTADDRLRGAVIQEIMCQGQLDFARIEQSFGIDFKDYFADELEDLPPLAADGLLHLTGDGFTVSNRGRLLLRAIAMVFDRYLHEDRVKKTFSRII